MTCKAQNNAAHKLGSSEDVPVRGQGVGQGCCQFALASRRRALGGLCPGGLQGSFFELEQAGIVGEAREGHECHVGLQ